MDEGKFACGELLDFHKPFKIENHIISLILIWNQRFATHYFVDDRNIQYTSKSLKNIEINCDLKSFTERLKANKISLNSNKTELLLFRSKDKKIPKT